MDQIKQFLDALFAAKEPGEHILIWLLNGRSRWFTDTDQAAAFAEANRTRDVYVGVALSPADHGAHLRLKIASNARMPTSISGLWADIDVADAAHAKKNLAPTIDDAKTVLLPDMPPSILLQSGGGLQAWWLFREPYTLDTPEEARKAGELATRWIRALRARATARGWDSVDSVGDLTRVMRVPGTTNCKIPGQPRPVQILDINHHRYNPSDLDDYLDLIGAARVTSLSPVAASEKLVYSPDAQPPFEQFQVLCDTIPEFKASWDHKRKDFKDQSASAYDMALANLVVKGGWADQEIAHLLIAHRRRYKEDLKLRDSYYAKTISRARATFTDGDFMRRIEDLITPEPKPSRDADGETKAEEQSMEDPMQKKAAIVEEISGQFGLTGEFRIIRITKYMSEPREYAIEIANGNRIRLGAVQNLTDPSLLKDKIMDLAGRVIPSFKKNAEWDKLRQALLDACIEVTVGEEGTDAGLAGAWLREYLSIHTVLDEFNETDQNRSPFLRDGRVYIYLGEFRRWIYTRQGDRLPQKEVGIKLRSAGASDEKVPTRGGKSSRQVWRLSEGFTPPKSTPPLLAPEWVIDNSALPPDVN